MSDLLIRNIGQIASGDLGQPLLDGDAILCRDGVIAAIGALDDVDPGDSDDLSTIDAEGVTVTPGLIDPHVHPVLGTFTPRQNTMGWIESYVHGGVTTMISCGEPHTPGRPKDPAGARALAMLAHKSFSALRPLGCKVHGGALLLEVGVDVSDLDELAAEGCWLIGEIGISSLVDPEVLAPFVAAARQRGFIVPVHVGGASVPGSSVIGADMVIAIQPDVASHCNGGPTAIGRDEVRRIIEESTAGVEVVQAGNTAALIDVVAELVDHDAIDRLQIASDTPSGTGVVPLAMLRTMAYVTSLAGIAPEVTLCAATGSTANRYRLPTGRIEVGRPADIVLLDAPRGSSATSALGALALGDTPSVCGVIIDGDVQVTTSRVTPPPTNAPRFGV